MRTNWTRALGTSALIVTLGGCTSSEPNRLPPSAGSMTDPVGVGPTTEPPPDGTTTFPTTGVAGATGTIPTMPTCGAPTSPPLPPGARGGRMPVLPTTATTAAKAPLPISGGTLLLLADGKTAVASDPDRDKISIVDLSTNKLLTTIALQPGDEPGRVAQDAVGRVHVALRHGGALVTLDPKTGTIAARRDVCAAPRGVAYQSAGDLVHVACASGELVSFPAAGGAATRTLKLEQDLRDVVVDKKGQLFVSTFRKAEALLVGADGKIAQRLRPSSGQSMNIMGAPQTTSPSVAWRMLPVSDSSGGVVMLHQTGVDSVVDPASGGYAGLKGCPGIVGSVVEVLAPDATQSTMPRSGLSDVSLAVDVAQSADGTMTALAVPGNAETPGAPTVYVGTTTQMTAIGGGGCNFAGSQVTTTGSPPPGEVVAVSFLGTSTSVVVAQTREPATLWRSDTGTTVSLGSGSFADTGHTLFHVNAGGGLACASCHPEGGEDGRVWNFACVGARRTQSVRGGISGTAPFHWDGSETDFSRLMDDVFVNRMAGPTLAADQKTALQGWIDKIPALPATRGLDAAAVARGQALFNDAKVACATCHMGSLLTNNATVDVGTGGALQVPSLRGVSWRAPFMHTGCAATLADRFGGSCGGADQHGVTSQLSASQVGDLVTYLQSL